MSIKDTLIEQYRKSENFPVASRAIPKHARKTIKAIYKFARNADNISDDPDLKKDSAKQELNLILENLESRRDHKLPIWAKSFAYNARMGNISVRHGKALILAFIQDIDKSRYSSWEDTLDYCQKSASTIGRMVLEANKEYSADFEAADKICIVLQLINHLQDLKEDYEVRGRIYFDKTIFPNEQKIKENKESAEITRGKKEVLSRLRKMLDEAKILPSTISCFRVRVEILTIINLSYALVEELDNKDILASKVKLSKKQKIFSLVKGVFQSLFSFHKDDKVKSKNENYAKNSSFLKPMLALDERRKYDMLCFYAFCRLLDDAADGGVPKPEALENLAFWQRELNKIYSSNYLEYPDHPISRNLLSLIERYEIPKVYFDEMIEGQLMDINEIMLKPERKIFYLYCYRVASCVGIITTKILGYKSKNKELMTRFATHLGKGFQIVNIIRDIKEDAEIGRIYIPQRILLRNSLVEVTTEEIAENFDRYKNQFAEASKELADLAKEHFIISEEVLPLEERENMKVPLLMRKVYKKYLEKMEKKGFIFDKKDIKLSKFDKLKIFAFSK